MEKIHSVRTYCHGTYNDIPRKQTHKCTVKQDQKEKEERKEKEKRERNEQCAVSTLPQNPMSSSSE